MTSQTDFRMTIDADGVTSPTCLSVVNPATEEVFASCPDCGTEQIDAAMDAARGAFATWRADDARRRQALAACAGVVRAHLDSLAELLTREQGKPLAEAKRELHNAASWLDATAALDLSREVLADDAGQRVVLGHRPLGVVAAIAPWNFPVLLAVIKVAPALRVGNCVVLKPSPYTPLTTLHLGKLFQSVLPPGVLNVISGGDALGARMVEHAVPRKVTFTGSVATGKKIMAAAAGDLKRVTLELGGNDPAIVLRDVDPAQVAPGIFSAAFDNCGQVCIAIKRVYVEEPVYAPLVDALAELARATRVGDGLDPETQMGPLNNRPQYERICGLLESARADGARFVAGGEVLERKGYFVSPTVVTGIEDGSRLVDEEQFGPVLPVIPVRSADQALERANRTHFGLGGSVWTADLARGAALASELECGTAWVNRHGAVDPRFPFGGCRWSGIGRENGPWGLCELTDLQVLSIAK